MGQVGFALTVRDRVVPIGKRDFSKRCWFGELRPGHEVALLSPQKRTEDCPTLATVSSPLTWSPSLKPGIRSTACSRDARGPGTSRVTKDPIWLMTVTWPWAFAIGVTK